MKSLLEIKYKLENIRDKKIFILWLDSIPESQQMSLETRQLLLDAIVSIINKIIKHLEAKNPSKSGIASIVNRSFYKLQSQGVRHEGQHCFTIVLEEILNNGISGFFNRRLNVKSKEFLDLEDWDPSKEN